MLNAVICMLVLVVGIVVSNLIATYVLMKLFMNKKTLKNYTKVCVEVANELAEEMLDGEKL